LPRRGKDIFLARPRGTNLRPLVLERGKGFQEEKSRFVCRESVFVGQ
jgi:hypothetical protein